MTIKAMDNTFWHHHSLFTIEGSQHVPVELRKEPILRAEQLSIEVCHHSNFFHLSEEFRLKWRPLSSLISFIIQIVNINLLIHAFQVNRTCLHSYLVSLLWVRLQWHIAHRELMSWVILFRELFGFTLCSELHLDHIAWIAHFSLLLFWHLSVAVVSRGWLADNSSKLLVIFVQSLLFLGCE